MRKLAEWLWFREPVPNRCETVKQWLETNTGSKSHYVKVAPSHEIHCTFPQTVVSTIHPPSYDFSKIESPETFVAIIPNGRVYSYSGVIISPDNCILRDVSLDFRNGPQYHSLMDHGGMPRRKRLNSTVAVINSSASYNYFHWVFDLLPRLEFVEQSGYPPDFYMIDQRYAFQVDYMEAFGIKSSQIIRMGKRSNVQAERLIVPSLPGQTGVMTRRACRFVQKTIFNAFQIDIKARKNGKKYIYVSRDKAKRRRVSNEASVVQLLEEYGFETVFLEGLPLREQVGLFANAEIIVAPHGAGLTNLVYCRPDCRVIEFFAQNYVNPCYRILCSQMNLDYACLLCEADRSELKSKHASLGENIKVNIDALKCLLD